MFHWMCVIPRSASVMDGCARVGVQVGFPRRGGCGGGPFPPSRVREWDRSRETRLASRACSSPTHREPSPRLSLEGQTRLASHAHPWFLRVDVCDGQQQFPLEPRVVSRWSPMHHISPRHLLKASNWNPTRSETGSPPPCTEPGGRRRTV